MFLQVSVCPQGVVWSRGVCSQRGVPGLGGMPGPQECLFPGRVPVQGGAWSQVGGCVPGLGGAWSQGMCLVQAGAPGPGGCLLLGGAWSWGGTWSQRGCAWCGGQCAWSRGVFGPGVCAWSWGGAWSREGWYPSMHWVRPPFALERRLLLQTVHILLQCILTWWDSRCSFTYFSLKFIFVLISWTLNEEYFSSGTTTLNRKLVVGDKVWVENIASHTYHAEYNVFSGNIIHPDF